MRCFLAFFDLIGTANFHLQACQLEVRLIVEKQTSVAKITAEKLSLIISDLASSLCNFWVESTQCDCHERILGDAEFWVLPRLERQLWLELRTGVLAVNHESSHSIYTLEPLQSQRRFVTFTDAYHAKPLFKNCLRNSWLMWLKTVFPRQKFVVKGKWRLN